MNISNLRHKVDIQENQGTVSDGGGNKTPNWVTIATVWAEVRVLNGAELEKGSVNAQELTHSIKIRYRAGIKKDKHRVNFGGRVMAIQYIINTEERNIELILRCREG